MFSREALWFVEEREVETRREEVRPLGDGEVLVEVLVSGISAGTEMLLYRGEMPADIPLDATIPSLSQSTTYPQPYGYNCVGRVVALSSNVDKLWINQLVFAFHPHASHFIAPVENLIPVPAGISPENALFLPNMETAVSLVMDGQPVIGENVVVFGLGVVGLLCSALLLRFPLGLLTTVDNYPLRCGKLSLMGDNIGISPKILEKSLDKKADLCYELTGNPAVLNKAIEVTGYAGRIVVGSWYGQKQAPLNLGSTFHRSHMQLIASQVSQLHPRWRGRWNKARRLDTAWDMIRTLDPARLITHRFPLAQAEDAYDLLDKNPEETVQVIFTYS